ncbi:farnesyl pyrophosphate synthase [Pelobates cultripes]|uniref:Farnesyl pyrophosphate synthase n=1 Tax=Pelobates cultripes TaxID=61616 RepID=A0AAD1WY89_PELCU|nr:farnesyl pyrophosphate synthase [Pelobates cultripes]
MWVRLLRAAGPRLRPLPGVRAPLRGPTDHFRVWTMASVGASKNSELQEFSSYFEQVVKDLIANDSQHPEIGDAITRLKEILEYNTPGGKCNRGMTVLAAYRELVGPDLQKDGNLQRALTVGWCVELLQAFFLVADDIMDNSVTRRGQPCWYKKDGIGLDAVNDSFLLEASIYRLLKKYCRGQTYYLHLLELFLEKLIDTELGQALDLITAQPGKVDLNRYTETRYKAIVKYKTAFYSFYLPVAAAMYMVSSDGVSLVVCDPTCWTILENETSFLVQITYCLSMGGWVHDA